MIQMIRNLVISFFILSLSACSYSPSLVKEMYNNLATDMFDEIKESVSLNSAQSTSVDALSKEFVQWHRRNKLPEYSQDFSKLAMQIQTGRASEKSWQRFFRKMDGMPHFEEANHLLKKMPRIARSLSDKQILQLEQNFLKQNKEEAKEIRADKLSEAMNKEMEEMFKFIGIKLSDKQMGIVSEGTNRVYDTRWQELEANKLENKSLIMILRQRNHPQFESRFIQLWRSQDQFLTKDARLKQKQNDRVMSQTVKALIDSFTPKQKSKFTSFLFSISQTFKEMANEK